MPLAACNSFVFIEALARTLGNIRGISGLAENAGGRGNISRGINRADVRRNRPGTYLTLPNEGRRRGLADEFVVLFDSGSIVRRERHIICKGRKGDCRFVLGWRSRNRRPSCDMHPVLRTEGVTADLYSVAALEMRQPLLRRRPHFLIPQEHAISPFS